MPVWHFKSRCSASQIVMSNIRGRTLTYAFTEQAVVMLASVLRSQRALEVNIVIMRTFVQLSRLTDFRLLAIRAPTSFEVLGVSLVLIVDGVLRIVLPGQWAGLQPSL